MNKVELLNELKTILNASKEDLEAMGRDLTGLDSYGCICAYKIGWIESIVNWELKTDVE